ncbi:MAG: hypothetical protein J7604_03580 [Sporocytophaga sp.]|uniref:hypothetical protein n=1 Tax=Sporocytophaga sp. TaxID=2231183 RepID=UPI001B1C9795|nr:hypothetical protein [Sporocytophaga sp.]MBO9699262.1 hypothetical protein [Sporocytophaga sp.]
MKNLRTNTHNTPNVESGTEDFDLLVNKVFFLEKEIVKLKDNQRYLIKERNDALDELSKYRAKTIKLKEEKRALKKQNGKLSFFTASR